MQMNAPIKLATQESMSKVTNHLVQLQELMLARAERETAMPGGQLKQLDEAIQALLNELPVEVRTTFSRMLNKYPLAIVPTGGKTCSACGLGLPISLVQSVRVGDHLQTCPSCGRYLYYSDQAPRRPAAAKGRRRDTTPKVGLERFSAESLMIPRLEATDQEGALAEICHRLHDEAYVDQYDRLYEEALKREAIVSTAVDHGLAFPHVRGVEGGGLTLALAISEKGIRFGGPSRTLTRILFFMVIPTAASAFYLKLLAGLTQTFRKEDARKKLMAAKTPEALWKALLKATKGTIS